MSESKNIKTFKKGLNLDSSIEQQPDNTYRFALNMINETREGDIFNISNEEANSECFSLPEGFIYLGDVKIHENKRAIFSVKTEGIKNDTISEIGIVDKDCNYTTVVNDEYSHDRLNFNLSKPIKAIYRLRRGCGNTIYWVDDFNVPRNYNFEKPENFKTAGKWDADKFKLQRTVKSIPIFNTLKVLNSGGFIKPGAVQVAIRQLDENFNPTEWSVVSNPLNIYNDKLDNSFLEIRGSISSDESHYNFPETTKSIDVEIDNLDMDFPYYQLAFLHYENSSGRISKILITAKLSTSNTHYVYTGKNYESEIAKEEILAFDNIIGAARTISQLDNTLLLSGITGKKVKLCDLQKYASKIKTDLYVKEVYLNVADDEANPKNPEVHLHGLGYMPGEIYSLGIVFAFADGTISPAFHIPGKSNNIFDTSNNNVSENIVYKPGVNTYPMALNNTSENLTYIDTNTCMNYWGQDSQGEDLKNTHIRHHRFPYRKNIGVPFIEKVEISGNQGNLYTLIVEGEGDLDLSCQSNNTCEIFRIKVTYDIDGVSETMYQTFDKSVLTNPFTFSMISNSYTSSNFTNVVITTVDSNDNATTDIDNLTTTESIGLKSYKENNALYKGYIYGLKFSNIELPNIEGEKIIGYYIVRQERGENDKTILDSAILTPTVKYKKDIANENDNPFGIMIDTSNVNVDENDSIYISSGLLAPDLSYSDWENKAGTNNAYSYNNQAYNESRLSKQIFGLITPEHKFRAKEYTGFKTTHQGQFDITDQSLSHFRYRDVLDGTSYDENHHSDDSEDKDGWSLRCITRDSELTFNLSVDDKYTISQSDIKDTYYLDPLESKIKIVSDKQLDIYNNTPDNKIGILHLEEEVDDRLVEKYPYVYLEKELEDYYPNFRLQPYYKISNNIETTETTVIFGGDTYISPMRYANSIFWDNRVAYRVGKTQWWKYLLAVVVFIVGMFVSPLLGIGAAALLISSGLKEERWQKAYNEEYEKGLRGTALDKFSADEFRYNRFANSSPNGFSTISPQDDEIQWIGDVLTNIWFESQINVALRTGMTDTSHQYFLDAPNEIEVSSSLNSNNMTTTYVHPGSLWGIDFSTADNLRILDDITVLPKITVDKYFAQKLSIFDADRNDLKSYTIPTTELYKVNEDYHILNKAKIYHHLPIEYDCCSNCIEKFPTRVMYSEQSFQEELTDNYRVFLPNNYRDIQGETGEITNTFIIKNNLYVHTENALWHLPQTYQERVTGDIVSFLGTGSYFTTPPRKIVDSENNSAGCLHSIATNKTKYGVFFISEKDKTVYIFDGNQLKNLNLKGLSAWLRENGDIQFKKDFYHQFEEDYDFDNNPTNFNGIGFISTFENDKKRFILTKKDFLIQEDVTTLTDAKIIVCDNGGIFAFENYLQIIADKEAQGWVYKGIKDCVLYFESETVTQTTELMTVQEYEDGTINEYEILVTVTTHTIDTDSINGTNIQTLFGPNNSWTLSYSINSDSWISWHSYLPTAYIEGGETFSSSEDGNKFWKHGTVGRYNEYYDENKGCIIDYVHYKNETTTELFDYINFYTRVEKWDDVRKYFTEDRFTTFNKVIMYNSRQCSGLMNLDAKDTPDTDNYMSQQVSNSVDTITLDKNEKIWSFNNLRDIRIDYTVPIFISDVYSLQSDYYTDKILNVSSLDYNKDWTQLENFRDKYLAVRLIFDTFVDRKLTFFHSIDSEEITNR